MRRAFFLTLLLPLLTVCSDTSRNAKEETSELPFVSYVSEPQPRGGQCNDSVDVTAPVIVNGFGFNHSNTRNQASLIDSTNVDTLALNYRYAPAAANEKRGAPAVTAQVIYLTSGSRAQQAVWL